MVSSAIAVLPVWRSPMISSRCPRPMGMSASMALSPVAIGSCPGLRGMVPGRLDAPPAPLGRVNRALAVERIAERVDDAPEQAFAHRNVHNGLRPLDGL